MGLADRHEVKILFKILKWFGIVMGSLLLLIIIVPLIIPIPALKDVHPAAALADADSKFIRINGIQVHYKQAGEGEPVFILLHGFGAYLFSWRNVMQPLAEIGTVIAYDRPGFGLTDRPLDGQWQGDDPYGQDGQVEMLADLMDALGIEKAILVGNSAGGTITTAFTIKYPQRVTALVEVDAAIYTSGNMLPGWLRPLLFTPQAERLGPLLLRSIQDWGVELLKSAWHDPGLITPEILEGYQLPLHVENWDKALFEMVRAPLSEPLAGQLDQLSLPVLVLTGDDDRIVPGDQSRQLARDIPNAELVVFTNCGHVPQEECPEQFMAAINDFVRNLR
jgi:pimeloyl-ACP methyl ester carboxylesterase